MAVFGVVVALDSAGCVCRSSVSRANAAGSPRLSRTPNVALLPLALVFSTARRGNGFAGLHDLLTGTRVVERRVQRARPERQPDDARARERSSDERDPMTSCADPVRGLGDEWRWGFDSRLRRHVWVRFCTAQTPPVPLARRALTRRARLRWLGGRRAGGRRVGRLRERRRRSVLDAVPKNSRWADVRWWLLDVAKGMLVDDASRSRAARSAAHLGTRVGRRRNGSTTRSSTAECPTRSPRIGS